MGASVYDIDVAMRRRTPVSREAVVLLQGLGRRYAAVVRVVTLSVTMVVALVAAADQAARITVLVVLGAVAVWSAVYVRRVQQDEGAWLTITDTVVLSILALSSAWVTPATWLDSGASWSVPFVSFAAVVYQYHVGRTLGAACGLTLAVAMVVGAMIAQPERASSAGVVSGAWAIVLVGLGRLLWTLVQRGAARADDILDAAESARQEQVALAGLRADEQNLAAVLHDTAATTLMMVGMGLGADQHALVGRRAARDLQVLGAHGDRRSGRVDLRPLLDAEAGLLSVPVVVDAPHSLWTDALVAHAVVGAVGEALTNAAKHARCGEVLVRVVVDEHCTTVRVADDGIGFDPHAVPRSCRGVRTSIVSRMRGVGGTATIVSDLRRGTTVVLEWRHEQR